MAAGKRGFEIAKHGKQPKCNFDGTPACATDEQYQEWLEFHNIALGHTPIQSLCGFCADCSPEYAASMRRQDRCEYPDIVFGIDKKNGGVVGVFPGSKRAHQLRLIDGDHEKYTG